MEPLELTPVVPARRPGGARVAAAAAARAARQDGLLGWMLDGPGWRSVRPTLDASALILAVLVVLRRDGEQLGEHASLVLALFPLAVMALLQLRGMYRRRLRVSILDGVAPVVSAVSLGVIVIVAAETSLFGEEVPGAVLVRLWVLALVGVTLGRLLAAGAQRLARSKLGIGRAVLVVGAGDIGRRVAARLQSTPSYGLRPIGFLDDDPLDDVGTSGLPVLGGHRDLEWVVSLTGTRHVVLAFSRLPDGELVDFTQRCAHLGLELSIVPRLFETVNDRFTYEAVGGLPLMALRPTRPGGSSFAVKHAFDFTVAATAILLLSPLLLTLAAAVKLTSRGPTCFRQRRVGADGRTFDLLKFRSMRAARPGEGFFITTGSAPGGVEGVDRRTWIGKVLRRTSLDELPQLFNVVRGHMSLVGPRPERPEFVEIFNRDVPRYHERHRVRSGITGWAQVHGLRGQTSLTDRVEWDNYYIEHWSFGLDLKILALTVLAVFRRAE